jgi:S-DNA-T family DNA segregation ATPase FtsK/SpoIIIE
MTLIPASPLSPQVHDPRPAASSLAAPSPAANSRAATLPDPVLPRPAGPLALLEVRAVGGVDAGRVWSLGMGEHTLGPAPDSAVRLGGRGVPWDGIRLTVTADGRAHLTFPSRSAGPSATDQDAVADVIWLRTIRALKAPAPPSAASRAPGQRIRWPEGAELQVGHSVLRLVRPGPPPPQDAPAPAAAPVSSTGRTSTRMRVLALPARPAPPAARPLPRRLAAAPRVLLGRPSSADDFRAALTVYRELRAAAVARVGREMVREWTARSAEAPDPAALALAALGHGSVVWQRRPGAPGRLRLRIGAVEGLSGTAVLGPGDPTGASDELAGPWVLPGLPVAVDPAEAGVLGVYGPPAMARALARWLVLQAAVLCGPDHLAVRILAEPSADGSWDWAGRLPHCGTWPTLAPAGPFAACDPRRVGNTVRELLTELDARAGGQRRYRASAMSRPEVIAVFDRASRLRRVEGVARILAEGPAVGIYGICVDDAAAGGQVPECRALLRCDRDALAVSARGVGGDEVHGVLPDLVGPQWCDRVAAAVAEHGYLGG